jgi:dihydroorotate dehydrogenase
MDKHAAAVPAWAALGFGFAELGGVTWHSQEGNPSPRLFRLVSEQALINRMGFNNSGAEAVAARLADWKAANRWPSHPIGINLGKSKITPLDQAPEDYANSLRVLWPHADFFVVNVSSPNTPNLRQLQERGALDDVLAAVQEVNVRVARQAKAVDERRPLASPRGKPILVKVAPDLSFEALDEIVSLVISRDIAGVVATNTTIARPAATDALLQRVHSEAGGLSGVPLRGRSTEVIRHLYRQTRGALPIIGVGGIFNAEDAWEKISAGASLLQLYTGLIYEGPGIASSIVAGLRERLAERGMKQIKEAVGSSV